MEIKTGSATMSDARFVLRPGLTVTPGRLLDLN